MLDFSDFRWDKAILRKKDLLYQDLRKLGASNAYLRKTAHGQISRVFLAPVVIGTLLILAFVCLILAANGEGGISSYEFADLRSCLVVVAVISVGLYGLYPITLRRAYRQLAI